MFVGVGDTLDTLVMAFCSIGAVVIATDSGRGGTGMFRTSDSAEDSETLLTDASRTAPGVNSSVLSGKLSFFPSGLSRSGHGITIANR